MNLNEMKKLKLEKIEVTSFMTQILGGGSAIPVKYPPTLCPSHQNHACCQFVHS